MKSENPGYEFDQMAKVVMNPENSYYLWGAALAGTLFAEEFGKRIKIEGFIDSDENKHGKILAGYKIYSSGILKRQDERVKIIVTSLAYPEIKRELEQYGFAENIDIFKYTLFAGIYFVYVLDQVYLDRVDISLTEKCTLKCRKCNMYMPYFDNPKDTPLDVVKEDVDALFSCVNKVNMLNLLGGEPFLYPYFKEIVEYIIRNYRNRINRIEIFTNAMIIPEDDLLSLLAEAGIHVQISDYTNKVAYQKRLAEFENKLAEYGIAFRKYNTDKWVDFGFPENPNTLSGSRELISFFDRCGAPFRGLYHKKLYYCHPNLSAIRAGIFEDDESVYFDLSDMKPTGKKELLEFDMGYSKNGFMKFCTVCRGCESVNKIYVDAAEQMREFS